MDTLTDIWEKINNQSKCAFISTFLFAVISQGMGLFNKFSTHDDLNYLLNAGDPLPLGRWMLYLLRRAERTFYGDGLFSLPVINGFIAIFCIALMVCFLIDLFEIRSAVLCILLGCMAVSIPVVTAMFGYVYTIHFYAMALFGSVLGPYLILKKNKWYFTLIGIGILTCSTGIYQAYIPVTLCVFLFWLIKAFSSADNREKRVQLYKKALIIVFSCAAFMAAYYFIMNFFLRRGGINLTNYKDVSSISSLSVLSFLKRIPTAYREFFVPAAAVTYDIFTGNIRTLYYLILALSALLSVRFVWNGRKNLINVIIMVFLMMLIPLAVNFIFIMVDTSVCSALMVYGRTMFYVYFVMLIENTAHKDHPKAASAVKAFCTVCLMVFIWMNCRFDNICYLRMELIQTQATRYFSTLVTRIQSTEGYNSWMNVSYIGSPHPGRIDNSLEEIPEFEYIKINPYYGIQWTVRDYPWKEYLRIWCGYTAHEMDQSYFRNDPEVQAMPHYPDDGSIKVIGDTLIVKF